jgi:hypothetical protein
MIRLTALAALLALAAEQPPASSPQPPTIRLDVQPVGPPVPALRYRLFPEVRDQNPGNAVQLYLRSLNADWFGSLQRDQKQYNRLAELAAKPLREFTAADVKEASFVRQWKALLEVDRAARRPYCDWELTERVRADGIGMLLPELQSMRSLADFIRLRARLELHDGKFDDAARSLQTGFAMARHVAEGPTLIHGLVGVAIATGMLQVVEDWINLPNAPNLYWALSNLPDPLIDLRKGYEGERLYLDAFLPGYREMLADPTLPQPSAQQLATTLRRMLALSMFDERGPRSDLNRGLETLALALRDYPEAKRLLPDLGFSADQVKAMPVLHAVFLYQTYKYDAAYDEARKWLGVARERPVPAVRTSRGPGRVGPPPFQLDLTEWLIPAVEPTQAAARRVQRKVAALRCVEAVRLFAAAHGGRLPPLLSDVAEVPVPKDPGTGTAFSYSLDRGRATLTGPPPAGETASRSNSLRYEITVRGPKGDR